jgi:hypothetical protein
MGRPPFHVRQGRGPPPCPGTRSSGGLLRRAQPVERCCDLYVIVAAARADCQLCTPPRSIYAINRSTLSHLYARNDTYPRGYGQANWED